MFKFFVSLFLFTTASVAQVSVFPPSGGGVGVGAANVTATCAGTVTTCPVTITSLALTSATQKTAITKCYVTSTGAELTLTALAFSGGPPLTTATPTFTSTTGVYCTVNSNGGAGATGATGNTGATGTAGATGPQGAAGSGNNSYCQDASASTTTYSCASPVPSPSTLSGLIISFVPQTTNTAASTVAVAALGAKTLKEADCTTDLIAGEIIGGTAYMFSYNGTVFCKSGNGGSTAISQVFYTSNFAGNVANALTAASSAGGGKVIVNQNYSSASSLVIPNNTTLQCLPEATITQTSNTTDVVFLTSPSGSNMTLDGCHLVGGNHSVAGFGSSSNVNIINNTMTGWHTGPLILTAQITNLLVDNNSMNSGAVGCSEGLFLQDNGDATVVTRNKVDTTGCGGAHGIALHTFTGGGNFTRFNVTDNIITNGGTNFGIEITQNSSGGNPTGGTIHGNLITVVVDGFGGISVGNGNQEAISDNTILEQGHAATIAEIEVANCKQVSVTGNRAVGGATNAGGLSMDSSTQLTVENNVFEGLIYIVNSGTFAGVTQLSNIDFSHNIVTAPAGSTTTHLIFFQCNVASCAGTNNRIDYNVGNGVGTASSYMIFVEQDAGAIVGTQVIGNQLNTYSAGVSGFANGALGFTGGLVIDTGGGAGSVTIQVDGGGGAGSGSTVNLTTGFGMTLTPSSVGGVPTVGVAVNTASVVANSALQNSTPLFVTNTSASATVYTGTMSPTLTSYGTGGATVIWQVGTTACTGGTATTLNIDALGAKAIKLADGTTNPTASDCSAGKLPTLRYDGTVFRIVGGGAAGSGGTTLVSPWGTWASRPSCTVAGQQWFATDGVGLTSICDGSTWHDTYLGIPITLPGLVSTYTNVNGGTATDTAGTIVFNKSTTGLGVELKLIPTGTGAGQQSGVWTVIGAFQAQETANFQSCGIYFTNGTATSSNAFGLVVPYRNDIAQPSFIQENEYGPISGGLSSAAFADNILIFPSPLVWFRFQRLNSANNTITFDIGDGRTWNNVGSVTETFQPTNYGFGCDPRGAVNANLTVWSLPTIQ